MKPGDEAIFYSMKVAWHKGPRRKWLCEVVKVGKERVTIIREDGKKVHVNKENVQVLNEKRVG